MTLTVAFKKKKKVPQYYKHRIEWVEIMPDLRAAYLSPEYGNREFIDIGKSINYSSERIRKIFNPETTKVNRVIWDAIVKYVEAKALPAKIAPKTTPVGRPDTKSGKARKSTPKNSGAKKAAKSTAAIKAISKSEVDTKHKQAAPVNQYLLSRRNKKNS